VDERSKKSIQESATWCLLHYLSRNSYLTSSIPGGKISKDYRITPGKLQNFDDNEINGKRRRRYS
jgi:hypothetical protein